MVRLYSKLATNYLDMRYIHLIVLVAIFFRVETCNVNNTYILES
jgi:hypothetical protein